MIMYSLHGVYVCVTWCLCMRYMVCMYALHGVYVRVTWCLCTRYMVFMYALHGVYVRVTWCLGECYLVFMCVLLSRCRTWRYDGNASSSWLFFLRYLFLTFSTWSAGGAVCPSISAQAEKTKQSNKSLNTNACTDIYGSNRMGRDQSSGVPTLLFGLHEGATGVFPAQTSSSSAWPGLPPSLTHHEATDT